MTESALAAPTRVLCYAIDGGDRAGDLLAVGSLLLPYFTTFHPDLAEPAPLEGLQDMIGDRKSGDVRVRLVVRGPDANETVDGTLFFGGDLENGGGWIASAVLDRPSAQPCQPLPAAEPADSSAAVLYRLFDEVPLELDDDDRSRRRPGRPRALTTARLQAAAPTGAEWPPPGPEGFRWVPQRPDWLPPLIPFPPIEIDVEVLRVHCPIICMSWWCQC